MLPTDQSSASSPSRRHPEKAAGSAHLSERERIQQKLRERAAALSAPRVKAAPAAVKRLITFRWRRQRWAVDNGQVQELIHVASPTALPGLPPAYLCLTHYRGDVFPVVDIAALFAIGEGSAATPTHALIVSDNGAAIAIAADAIEGVSKVDVANIAAMSPDTVTHSALQGLTPDQAILFDPHHLLGDSRLVVNDQPEMPSHTEGKAQ
jgi:chemotaxis signal transduction protein